MVFTLLVLTLAQVSSQPRAPQTPPQPPVRDGRPAVTGTGIIRGRVVADDTGEPIRGCLVFLMAGRLPAFGPPPSESRQPVMSEPLSARTNENGLYEFKRLAAGTYRLSASPEMSNPRYVGSVLAGPGSPFGKPFELADGQKLDAAEIRLQRGSVLTGRVIDEFGDPVAHVRVNALLRLGGGEPRQVGGFPNGTDDLGRFRLFGLRAGEYFLVAEPQQFGPPGGENRVRPLPTYLPSSLTLAEATPIRLRPGQEIGDLEIRLASGRTFKISGTILTSQGQPFSRRYGQLMFTEPNMGGGMSGRSVELRDDGTFEVRGVKPGTYSIEAGPMRHLEDETPAEAEFGTASVTVTDSDVEGVTVVTQPGATVSGEVVFDEPPADASQPLYATAATASRGIAMRPPVSARVAPDGTFKLRGLSRPVYIRVSPPPGYHIASVTLDGQDITDTPMEFNPEKAGRLLVSLTRRSSELSGQVHDAQGRPASALVFAFGEDRALWTSFATTTKYTSVDEKGSYKLSGLRPDRYLVLAVPPGSGPPMMFDASAEAWERFAKQATVVTIGDQERKTLDLKLSTELNR